jgi:hypothetical protein
VPSRIGKWAQSWAHASCPGEARSSPRNSWITSTFRDGLLITLVARYEADHSSFMTLPKQALDSSLARGVVAELRNDGYVEEQLRGVIRLTARGYREYRSELPYGSTGPDSLSFLEFPITAFAAALVLVPQFVLEREC